MPKFQANSLAAIRDPIERVLGRVSRMAEYAKHCAYHGSLERLCYIVAAEADDGSWCELDAESLDHAKRLAIHWIDTMKGRGASVWEVMPNGRLASKNSFSKFEQWG